jgi:hypothetical protein
MKESSTIQQIAPKVTGYLVDRLREFVNFLESLWMQIHESHVTNKSMALIPNSRTDRYCNSGGIRRLYLINQGFGIADCH